MTASLLQPCLDLNRDLLLLGPGVWSNLPPENFAVGAGNTQEESKAAADHEREEEEVIHQSGPQVDEEYVEEAWVESTTEDKNLREHVEGHVELVMGVESKEENANWDKLTRSYKRF